MAKKQKAAVGNSRKKSISIMEDAKKTVDIAHDGKKWSSIKIGIDTKKLIPQFSLEGGVASVQSK